jgi:hypothetical protein
VERPELAPAVLILRVERFAIRHASVRNAHKAPTLDDGRDGNSKQIQESGRQID